jgi:iron-sulfur cluster assembly accessory protein
MITITEKAKKEIERLVKAKSDTNLFLRVAIEGGGCSGFSYTVKMDSAIGQWDKQFGEYPNKVVCDQKSFVYLDNTQLDFSDELVGGGFNFKNPNASGTCGCGQSFSI